MADWEGGTGLSTWTIVMNIPCSHSGVRGFAFWMTCLYPLPFAYFFLASGRQIQE